jgi:DNA invertase Pin-like site-specific DNA recombinase
MNCVLYARVSTDKQAEKELSIPAQLTAARDYADRHGWTVVREFVEAGASARTADRPVLQQMLRAVQSDDGIQVVLVHKIDRLARNVYDHATIRALLQQRRVRLASVVENVDDSVPGQLVENIMASIAQFYSANLSEETRKGMRQKVLKGGWPHMPPRGYRVAEREAGSTLEIDPSVGPVIRRAFELFASGVYSVGGLGRQLAREGLCSKSGGPIPKSHVHRMLTNVFYIGRIRWKDLDVPGSHPPLITEDLFERVQTALTTRSRDPGVQRTVRGLPLRRVAQCAMCRSRVGGEWHQKWGYYRCSRRSYRKDLCTNRMCNAKRAHAQLEEVLKSVQITQATGDQIREAVHKIIDQKTRSATECVSELESERASLLDAQMALTEAYTTGKLASRPYRRKSDGLTTRRQQVESELRAGINASDVRSRVHQWLDVAVSLWDLYDRLDDRRREDLIGSVFVTVILDETGIVGYSLKEPFRTLLSRQRSGAKGTAERLVRAA